MPLHVIFGTEINGAQELRPKKLLKMYLRTSTRARKHIHSELLDRWIGMGGIHWGNYCRSLGFVSVTGCPLMCIRLFCWVKRSANRAGSSGF